MCVKYGAAWSSECQAFKTVFETVANKFPRLIFVMVDVSMSPTFRTATKFKVDKYPTVLGYQHGLSFPIRYNGALEVEELYSFAYVLDQGRVGRGGARPVYSSPLP